jgi:hypothetical protein
MFKAAKDVISHKFDISIWRNKQTLFYDPKYSWQNKYKDYPKDKRELFWGSTRWFVWITDAWHFFDMVKLSNWQLLSLMNMILVWQNIIDLNKNGYVTALVLILYIPLVKIWHGIVFEYYYKNVFIDEKYKDKQH